MRHRKAHRKLNRTSSHRKAMLRTMVTEFLEKERIITTVPKAK
ncbi:MAG TPA: 50S ribosomal protein L17, partial [Acidobacteriota bacterium]|nr:50S ribosomal protein L17 [Acidobacteriota bacterium]